MTYLRVAPGKWFLGPSQEDYTGFGPRALEIGSVRERAHKTKLQDYAPGWTVDSVTDGLVAFDAAKALMDRAGATVCRAKVGHCVYDFVRDQAIRRLDDRPLFRGAAIV